MRLLPSCDFDDSVLQEFLLPQVRDHGGKVEIDEGLWALFAVPATDALANAIARSILADAPFAHDAGASADEAWTLYYVDGENRAEAAHWVGELPGVLAGEIRTATPAQRSLINEVACSDTPHRAAQRLAGMHESGEVSAGLVRDPATVRTLLDRMHQRDPLFFSALLILLNHHLVDLVVLLQKMIPEDLELKNEILRGGISRDPFLQSRQTAAAEIRHLFTRFRLINPLDQQKNTAISNPYAAYMEVVVEGDMVLLPLEGMTVPVPRAHFVRAVHTLRRHLGRGEEIARLATAAPWVTKEIIHPFRFIRQRVEARRDLAAIDALYMLERAVEMPRG